MMKRQSVLLGSVWLIASTIAAKILGAVFRIPLTSMLGGTGMGYYSCAYGLFLPIFALSVNGINTAVAAVSAQSLARDDAEGAYLSEHAAKRMFSLGGLLLSVLLFVSADPLCRYVLHNPAASLSVKCFSPAVFFCCMTAVLRGSFEGRHQMTPTAVSQVTEGFARVCFGLLLTGLVLRYSDVILPFLPEGTEPAEAAAAAAVFGVTLSTAIGLLTILLFPRPLKIQAKKRSRGALYLPLLQILLPVAAASLVTNLTTLIDLAAGLRVLGRCILADPAAYGISAECSAEQAQQAANFLYGAYSGLAVTVFNLVPSVTNMLGKGVFPAFAESFTQGDSSRSQTYAEDVLRRTAFFAVPAGFGMAFLAEPILQLLFSSRQAEIAAAAPSLQILGIAVIFAALSTPLFSMLQAAGYAGEPVQIMLPGAAVKLTGNLLLIPLLGLRGAAAATLLCYTVIFCFGLYRFCKVTCIPLQIGKMLLRTLIGGLICAGTAFSLQILLQPVIPEQKAVVPLSIAAGGLCYLLCMRGTGGIRLCKEKTA